MQQIALENSVRILKCPTGMYSRLAPAIEAQFLQLIHNVLKRKLNIKRFSIFRVSYWSFSPIPYRYFCFLPFEYLFLDIIPKVRSLSRFLASGGTQSISLIKLYDQLSTNSLLSTWLRDIPTVAYWSLDKWFLLWAIAKQFFSIFV